MVIDWWNLAAVVIIVVLIGIGVSSGQEIGAQRGQAVICSEIDWQSPTCLKLKAERLKP